jgi:hypothetical protein
MEAKYPLITLSQSVVEKIKIIYFPDKPWPECYKNVAQKFTGLKQKMRKFYTGRTDIEILHELRKYSDDDIKEAFSVMEDTCDQNRAKPMELPMQISTEPNAQGL